MKIVINAFSARLGGGQTYLRNLLAHLPEDDGLEVLVFAPMDLKWPEHPRVRRVHTAWPTTNPWMRALWERFALPGFLRRERADVLFCPGGVVGTQAPRGCRVVTMFRNMTPFDERATRSVPWGRQRLRLMLLRRVMLRSMSQADLTIFISTYARSVIEGLTPIAHPLTIPHGIAAAFRPTDPPQPRPTSLGQGDYLLYVSKFDTYKHHLEVIRAYAGLAPELRARYRLVLVGETDHPLAAQARDEIAVSGLQDRVVLYGPAAHGELPAMYQHAYANLFASSCENCPNILLEALASGRPVLSSNVMPMPEFGGAGIDYFSPFDSADIARAMTRLLTDPAHAERVAAFARERSAAYDWAATARSTWQAILSLAD